MWGDIQKELYRELYRNSIRKLKQCIPKILLVTLNYVCVKLSHGKHRNSHLPYSYVSANFYFNHFSFQRNKWLSLSDFDEANCLYFSRGTLFGLLPLENVLL